MSGTDLTVRNVELTNDQLQYIAHTEFVPPGLRGNVPAILACVATGRALGIADMTAIRSIHIIDGKATFSAELMVMLARKAGHSIQGDVSEGKATVIGKRADNGDTMTVEWTLAMADRAGLANKQNWRKYPEAMLWARAVSQLCRELFADCFAGATYTPEELEGSAGEPTAGSEGAPPSPVSQAAMGREPASPADNIRAAAEQLEPADMADPAIPFGDAPVPEHQPPASSAQKKKLNVLIGKLRPEKITNEQLYERVGREPVLSDDGELHWSPLRDSLTKIEASNLIEWMQLLDPQPVVLPAQVSELTAALVAASKRPAATATALENHAAAHTPEDHYAFLLAQAQKNGVAA